MWTCVEECAGCAAWYPPRTSSCGQGIECIVVDDENLGPILRVIDLPLNLFREDLRMRKGLSPD